MSAIMMRSEKPRSSFSRNPFSKKQSLPPQQDYPDNRDGYDYDDEPPSRRQPPSHHHHQQQQQYQPLPPQQHYQTPPPEHYQTPPPEHYPTPPQQDYPTPPPEQPRRSSSSMSSGRFPTGNGAPQPSSSSRYQSPSGSQRSSGQRPGPGPPMRLPPSRDAQNPDWDFILPELPAPPNGRLNLSGKEPFNFPYFVWAVVNKTITAADAKKYVDFYDENEVADAVAGPLCGFPSIFYAVASNEPRILRMWVKLGADVHAVHQGTGAPLVAFAVFNAENVRVHTTKMVAMLMSLGSHHTAFPKSWYTPFNKDLGEYGPEDNVEEADEAGQEEDGNDRPDEAYEELTPELQMRQSWLLSSPAMQARLARTMNLTQRYFLFRAATIKKPTQRQVQVATRKNAADMLGIQYFIVGQTQAAQALRSSLLTYLALPGKRPLVLVFAGPSGHGKTELSRQMGELLNLPMEIADCTIMKHESDLFGARAPYKGSENGSPFNNFLADNSGKPCIMFMDEFEKTTEEIHKALLIPFDNGEYQDRRNLDKVDCSKTIWILATNELDSVIRKFWNEELQVVLEDAARIEDEAPGLMKDLEKKLKARFLRRFKPPLTGRITSFIPFLPFTPPEQAVVAHKCVLDLIERARKPIQISDSEDQELQLLGNVELVVKRDASVCTQLAKDAYNPELGVRSLIMGIKHLVEEPLVQAFLEEEGELEGGGDLVKFDIEVQKDGIVVFKSEC